MPWVRLDDGYPEHPKVDRVGPLAAWLNVCAWAYCARNLTDGFVPEERVVRLAAIPKPQQLVERLVHENLWERVTGGYVVHDYLDYNPSREQVLKERSSTAQRVAEHRAKRNGVTPPDGNGGGTRVSKTTSNGVTNGSVTGAPYPSRLHPDVPPQPPVGAERRGSVPKPKPERVPVTDDDIEELVGKYAERYGSRLAVRDEIDQALNHQARFKAIRERLYVDGWLRRELEHRPGGLRLLTNRANQPRHDIDRTGVAN